jgi:catechol 2,3-dioxygenase-like lactoylglutathione lyase family enzyme
VLKDSMMVTTIAVADLEAARQFYGEQLSLPLLDETPYALRFGCGEGGQVSVRVGTPNVGNTIGHFEVADLDGEMAQLRAHGIAFEEYESPKTTDGVAEIGPARGAWIKDPSGNVIGLREGPVPAAG